LEDLKKKCLYFSTKQKNSLNIQGLLCRIEEKKNSIILPSIIKTPLIYWVFAELTKWLCYSTKQKKTLEYPRSSAQNQDPGCLRTEVKGDFNISGTKYF
jgi:hypothetical protein